MTVYVDDVRLRFRTMFMCHCWSDESEEELLAMMDLIGVQRRWIQKPPKASWVHFDISLGKKKLAIRFGAVLTDKYGPVEYVARLRGDAAKLLAVAECRQITAGGSLPPDRARPETDQIDTGPAALLDRTEEKTGILGLIEVDGKDSTDNPSGRTPHGITQEIHEALRGRYPPPEE